MSFISDYLPTWLGGAPAPASSDAAAGAGDPAKDKITATALPAIGRTSTKLIPTKQYLMDFKKLVQSDSPEAAACKSFNPPTMDFFELLYADTARDHYLTCLGKHAPLFRTETDALFHKKLMLYAGNTVGADKSKASQTLDPIGNVIKGIWEACSKQPEAHQCEVNGQRAFLNVLRVYFDYFTATLKWDDKRVKFDDPAKNETNIAWINSLTNNPSFIELFRQQLWQRVWVGNSPSQTDHFDFLGFIALLLSLPKRIETVTTTEASILPSILYNPTKTETVTVQPGIKLLRNSLLVWTSDIVAAKKAVEERKTSFLETSFANFINYLREVIKEGKISSTEKAEAIKSGKMPYYFSYHNGKSQAEDIESLFPLEVLQNENFIAVMKVCPAKEAFFELLALNPKLPFPAKLDSRVTKEMSALDAWKFIYS